MKTIDIEKALILLEDETKPYNLCIKCSLLNGTGCNGPAIIKMSPARRVEWFQLLRAYLRSLEPWKWSYAYIAEAADLSENTVIKTFNDPDYDPRVSTLTAIFNVMCPSRGENSCPLKSLQTSETIYEDKPETLFELNSLRDSMERTRRILENIHDSYAKEIREIRNVEQRKVDFLTKEVSTKNEQIANLTAQIIRLHEQNDKLINKLVN